jgi:arylsulfatase A-like enzyme
VHENDVQLGWILDHLDETEDPRRPGRPLSENTLVIFASDNGAEVKSKRATGPLRSHKGSTYEGGHRIPFIASWPLGGIRGQTESRRLLGLNDLFATVAEALEQPLPFDVAVDSISQLGAFRGEAVPPRPPLFPNDHKEASQKLSDKRAWVAVRSNDTPLAGQWKLFLDERFAFEGQLKPKELYELASDPREERNRIDDPTAKRAVDFLLERARAARGDGGRTREGVISDTSEP